MNITGARYFLYHYSDFNRWLEKDLLQIGPNIKCEQGIICMNLDAGLLYKSLGCSLKDCNVLFYYTDNFYIRSSPLRNLRSWVGPKILVCADLHHGNQPLETLEGYLRTEVFDAVLLLCNYPLLHKVRLMTDVPVRFLPPSFFRYPEVERSKSPKPALVHVGNIGVHHQERRMIVEELLRRKKIPFFHYTTDTPEESVDIYADYAIALNIPLNNDLNHRFFEIIGGGCPQIVLGSKEILGNIESYELRGDIFWVDSISQIEQVAEDLLSRVDELINIETRPYYKYTIHELAKNALRHYVVT